MRSGIFDPYEATWQAVERGELERLRCLAEERKDRPRLTLTAKSTKAEVAAFHQAHRAQEDVLAERMEQRMETEWGERDERFCEDLERYWRDATWMCNANGFIGHFPNGRCLNEQRQIDLTIWGILITAMINRMNGVKPEGDDEEEAERWRTQGVRTPEQQQKLLQE